MRFSARALAAVGLTTAVIFAGCSSGEPAGVAAKPPADNLAAADEPSGPPPTRTQLDRKARPNTEVLEAN